MDMGMVLEPVRPGVPASRGGNWKAGVTLVLAVGMGSIDAFAQESGTQDLGAGTRPAWTIVPRINVTEIISDRSSLNASGNGSGEQTTQISPGIHIDGQSGRAKLYLDYSLNQIYYMQDSGRNQTQNALTALGTLEALEKQLFVDVSGSISQTSISAFGPQSTSNASINSNSTETSTYRVSPHLIGHLGAFADYDVRYDWVTTSSRSGLASDSTSENWTGALSGSTPLTAVGWALNASAQTADYTRGRRTEADRLYGSLVWTLDPQFRLRASAGTESNNYVSADQESHATHGYGFDWSPTERTTITAFREKRFFGDGHLVTFSHRTPLTAWRFSDSRDVTALNQTGNVSLGTNYDFVLALIDPSITNPAARAFLAEVFFLTHPEIPRNGLVTSNFLASQATLSRRRDLSFIITGTNNTVTFSATQNRQQALASQSLALFADSFTQATTITQRGFGVHWSHTLSAQSSLGAGFTHTTTQGSSGRAGDIKSTQKSLDVIYSTRLGPKTGASLSLRHSVFDSDAAAGFTENTITGTLNAQF